MKKVLSSLIALILAISTTSFAAFHVSYVFKGTGPDGKTYNYFFGWFDEGDQEVGLTIDGKDYVLDEEAYAKASLNDNKFGIGIHSEEDFTAIPYAVDAEDTRTEADAKNIAASAPETVVTYDLLPQEIKLDGELIETFQKERNYYYVTVYNDTVPQITAVKNSASASVNVTVQQASAVPGTATVTLSDPYGNQNVITVYLEKPEAFQENQTAPLMNTARVVSDGTGGYTLSMDPQYITSLKCNEYGNLGNGHYYGLLKFDLSQLSAVSGKALLKVAAVANRNTSGGYLGAFAVEADDFSAEAIPALPGASAVIDKVAVNDQYAEGHYVVGTSGLYITRTLDVTDYIKYRLSQGKTTAVIALKAMPDELRITGEVQICVAFKSTPSYINSDGSQDTSIAFAVSDPSLSEIRLDGSLLEGFSADQTSYTVNLADGAALPAVTATAVEAGTNIAVSDPAAGENSDYTVTITSTGKDGNVKTYTVKFQYPVVYEKGTFAFKDAARMKFSAFPTIDYTAGETKAYTSLDETQYLSIRNLANNLYNYRETSVFRFDMNNIKGLNAEDRIIFTFECGKASSTTSTVQIKAVEVENETWSIDTQVSPLFDSDICTSAAITTDYSKVQKVELDVTEYIRQKIASGESTVSIALFTVNSDNTASQVYLYGTLGTAPYLSYAE